MNKKLFGILALLIIFSLSIFTYQSVYRGDKSQLTTVDSPVLETPAEDSAVIEAPDTDSISSPDAVTITAEDGQAPNGPVAESAEDIPPAASPSGSNETAKKVTSTASVSRGVQAADTYKYPQLSKVNGSFGQFYYRDLSGGRIEIDPNWIAANIVTITLPGLNQRVQVNKAAADNFIQAFTYIKNGTAVINGKQVSLLSLIDSMDGTFVTRHVNWNPAKGLSNHSWGTAMDINADSHFRYIDSASEPNDPNLILWEKAFKPAGFSWGNRYSDSMHFELID